VIVPDPSAVSQQCSSTKIPLLDPEVTSTSLVTENPVDHHTPPKTHKRAPIIFDEDIVPDEIRTEGSGTADYGTYCSYKFKRLL